MDYLVRVAGTFSVGSRFFVWVWWFLLRITFVWFVFVFFIIIFLIFFDLFFFFLLIICLVFFNFNCILFLFVLFDFVFFLFSFWLASFVLLFLCVFNMIFQSHSACFDFPLKKNSVQLEVNPSLASASFARLLNITGAFHVSDQVEFVITQNLTESTDCYCLF